VDEETRTLDRDLCRVCNHTVSLHSVQSGMCLAVDRQRRGCGCNLRAQIEALRALLREAAGRRLTVEDQDAVAQLAQTLRALLDQTDLP
jgi:hypothetical protein